MAAQEWMEPQLVQKPAVLRLELVLSLRSQRHENLCDKNQSL
jgi:hypothetical protein